MIPMSIVIILFVILLIAPCAVVFSETLPERFPVGNDVAGRL